MSIPELPGTLIPDCSTIGVPEFVVADFPFPLALTCHRVCQSLARQPQEPVQSAWLVRDAFECLLKFVAYLGAADCLATSGNEEIKSAIATILLDDRGLSVGHWNELLQVTLKPQMEGRRLVELRDLFFSSRGKPTALKNRINDFAHWRNELFGHGIFQRDLTTYSLETERWLKEMIAYYNALQPIFARWRLAQTPPEGEPILWQGAHDLSFVERHEHRMDGAPVSLSLVPVDPTDGPSLELGPLMTIQKCKICGQPAAFFFDRFQGDLAKKIYRGAFREYFEGHKHTYPDKQEARRDPQASSSYAEMESIARHVPINYEWERSAYSQSEIARQQEGVFRSYEQEYQRPDYLADWFWQEVADKEKGYLYLIAPEGIGKSYFVRGLAQEDEAHYARVLSYHLVPGDLTDYTTFVSELRVTAAKRMDRATQEIQTNISDLAAQRQEVASFLRKLKDDNKLSALILAIDALDELPEPASGGRTILDILPLPEALPEGCFILLTSRLKLANGVQAKVDTLRQSGQDLFAERRLQPENAQNQALLLRYLNRPDILPEPFRNPTDAETILARSGGIFLYAFHLTRALSTGAFPDTASLPAAARFYPAYLQSLRTQAGESLFKDVYLRLLLLLCAARQPVTRDQLLRWGLQDDRLTNALRDLRDFLSVQHGIAWIDRLGDDDNQLRYRIAHEDFIRYVQTTPDLAPELQQAHRHIALAAIQTNDGLWEELDADSASNLYYLRFVVDHCQGAGITHEEMLLSLNDVFARGCWRTGSIADEQNRHQIAVELFDKAIYVFTQIYDQGKTEIENYLAGALMNKGIALASLNRYEQAIEAYDQAFAIRQRLVDLGNNEIENDLAKALVNKGNVLINLTHYEQAIQTFDHAIEIFQRLVDQGNNEIEINLATALVNKGVALRTLTRYEQAIEAYDQAIAIRQRLVDQGNNEIGNDLASALVNKGVSLDSLTHYEQAIQAYEKAIEIFQRLVGQGRNEIENDLATALMSKGVALRNLTRYGQALKAFDRAVAIRQRLVDQGRNEIENDLAGTLVGKGVALDSLTHYEQAIEVFDQAIEIYQLLMAQGRKEIQDELAMALSNKGVAFWNLALYDQAIEAFTQAIEIFQRLVANGRNEIENYLAMLLSNKGNVLGNLTHHEQAIEAFDQSIEIFQRLVNQGKNEVENNLAMVLLNKANSQMSQGYLEQAQQTCATGINLWIQMLQSGSIFILPNLIKGFRIRFALSVHLERWKNAANDLESLAICTYQAIESGIAIQVIKSDMVALATRFVQLPKEHREGLYLLLDERTRSFMDQLLALLEGN